MASLKKRKEQIRDIEKKSAFFFNIPFSLFFESLYDKQKKMLSYYHLTLLKLIYQRINVPKIKKNNKEGIIKNKRKKLVFFLKGII